MTADLLSYAVDQGTFGFNSLSPCDHKAVENIYINLLNVLPIVLRRYCSSTVCLSFDRCSRGESYFRRSIFEMEVKRSSSRMVTTYNYSSRDEQLQDLAYPGKVLAT